MGSPCPASNVTTLLLHRRAAVGTGGYIGRNAAPAIGTRIRFDTNAAMRTPDKIAVHRLITLRAKE